MSPLALVLALSMGVGFLVQQCDLSGFSIGDVSHHLSVANTSPTASATVLLVLADGSSVLDVPAGKTVTADTVVGGSYTLQVVPDAAWNNTIDALKHYRDTFEQAILDPSLSPTETIIALGQLQQFNAELVQEARQPGAPTCTGTINPKATVTQASLSWSPAGGFGGSWGVHCG